MAARHKSGSDGKESPKTSQGPKKVKPYDAKGSNVEKEVEEKASGGRVGRKDGGKVDGCKPKMRMDRMKRASGGRVGSDKSPLSSANGATAPKGHSTDD